MKKSDGMCGVTVLQFSLPRRSEWQLKRN